MDAIALDSVGYDGTYKLVGGRLALDFVNTVSWPLADKRHDWLGTADNVTAWLNAVGLDDDRIEVIDDDLDRIRRLRGVISDAVFPLAHGATPPAEAIEALNDVLSTIAPSRRIEPSTLSWDWAPPAASLDFFRPVVDDAAEIITHSRTDRLKHCPSCDWLFEDQTRNGKRRWCDMADCGSRAKSRDYYHRTRATT